MNENLRQRKTDFAKYLHEELLKKPPYWWQQSTAEFILTKDVGDTKNDHFHYSEETIIKFDFKRALNSSALFFAINLLLMFYIWFKGNAHDINLWIMVVVLMGVIAYPLLQRSNKDVIIQLNREGFFIKTMEHAVSWDHLAASYIKKDNSGESTRHYLIMVYYDELKDEFVKTEHYVDGLDMPYETIALYIEYWKIRTGNTTTVV
ncbi:hypothetical protein [Ferruginibacter sp.]